MYKDEYGILQIVSKVESKTLLTPLEDLKSYHKLPEDSDFYGVWNISEPYDFLYDKISQLNFGVMDDQS